MENGTKFKINMVEEVLPRFELGLFGYSNLESEPNVMTATLQNPDCLFSPYIRK